MADNKPKSGLRWELWVDGRLLKVFEKKPPAKIVNMQRLKGIEIRCYEAKGD